MPMKQRVADAYNHTHFLGTTVVRSIHQTQDQGFQVEFFPSNDKAFLSAFSFDDPASPDTATLKKDKISWFIQTLQQAVTNHVRPLWKLIQLLLEENPGDNQIKIQLTENIFEDDFNLRECVALQKYFDENIKSLGIRFKRVGANMSTIHRGPGGHAYVLTTVNEGLNIKEALAKARADFQGTNRSVKELLSLLLTEGKYDFSWSNLMLHQHSLSNNNPKDYFTHMEGQLFIDFFAHSQEFNLNCQLENELGPDERYYGIVLVGDNVKATLRKALDHILAKERGVSELFGDIKHAAM
jgi:hypothetical protein